VGVCWCFMIVNFTEIALSVCVGVIFKLVYNYACVCKKECECTRVFACV